MRNIDLPKDFITETEKKLSKDFLENGYVIVDIKNKALLNHLRSSIASFIRAYLSLDSSVKTELLLNETSSFLNDIDLNKFRLHVLNKVNSEKWFRPAYYNLVEKHLSMLVGNELVMQKKVNLSIQLPNDSSSLLNLHADTWSGDSPYEIVCWLPLVDCYKTKSMYILPPSENEHFHENFASYSELSSEELFSKIENKVVWIEIPYGSALLFNQALPHGNRVNTEKHSRWSMNCRFKSVFSPYVTKKIGDFFEPISLKAVSQAGISYRLPVINK